MFSKITSIWRDDTTLRRVVKNSGHLLSGSAISAALGLFQTFLTKQMLDIGLWGLVGVIVLFATNINRLLSFRMSEVVVQRLGAALPRISPGSSELVLVPAQGMGQGKTDEAAASVKAAMLTEASTSIIAFIVLAVLAPWAAVYFAKDIQTAPLFLLYGLILLSNIISESSTGVLQALRRFNWIARINIVQSVITTGILLFVFFTNGGIGEIILGYTVGKTINGLGLAVFALRELHKTLGAGWWKTPMRNIPDGRKMFSFMVNSNLNGTVYLFTRDSMALILAHILSTAEAGYFNLALTMVNFIMLPLDPLISPTYAEIIHTVALKQWDATRQLLRRVSLISASVVFSVSAVLALTGWFVIPLFFKTDAAPAYPVLLILLIGYGFASIFQWNRPLLLALGKPGYPVIVALITGLAELTLISWLVPQFGYLALAGILSAYFVVSIGIIVWRGLTEIARRQEDQRQED
jgi:O-antigen/teichoic acid export membrane protein